MQKTKYLIITFFFLCANFQTYAQNNTEDLINKDALLKKAKSLVENVIDKTKPSNGNQSTKMVELLAKGEILDLNILQDLNKNLILSKMIGMIKR